MNFEYTKEILQSTICTLWYKQNNRTKEYEYNHIENCYNYNSKPTPFKPEFTAQNDWKNYNWKKSFAEFKDGKIINEIEQENKCK